MQFVYPGFLWALTAVSIPVIIHLFHFRRYKKVVFSDIRLLAQLQEQNKASQKLKDWLILLMRILAISALVLAFAKPFFPAAIVNTQGGNHAVAIFVDNSYSMNANGSSGPVLEMAKEKARAVVNGYPDAANFIILTNALSGAEQRVLSKKDALESISKVEPSAYSASLNQIYKRSRSALQTENPERKNLYLISDFQQKPFSGGVKDADSSIVVNALPVKHEQVNNISVDSIYFNDPHFTLNKPISGVIKLTNHGKNAVEALAVKIYINEVQKVLVNVNIGGGEQVNAPFTLTINQPGIQKGKVEITDYPIIFDDVLYFSIQPDAKQSVLLISNTLQSNIKAVYADDASYQLIWQQYGNINYTNLADYNFIILNEPTQMSSGLQNELTKYIEQGGTLLYIPNAEQPLVGNAWLSSLQFPLYGNLTKQSLQIEQVQTRLPVLQRVYEKIQVNTAWPKVFSYMPLTKSGLTKGTSVASLNNGEDFLWQANLGKGVCYQLAVPLAQSSSNFTEHSLFVAFMLNAALGSKRNLPTYQIIGQSLPVEIKPSLVNGEKLIELKSTKQQLVNELTFRKGQPYIETEGLSFAGWYAAYGKEKKQIIAEIAMNESRLESEMKFLDDESFKQLSRLPQLNWDESDAKIIQAGISGAINGTQLWRYFILAACLFLLVEILLIRLLK